MAEVSSAHSTEYEAFVRDTTTGLLRAARVMAGDWATAEDLVQTALLKAWRHWDRIRDVESPQAYVHRVMTNEHSRLLRRRWRNEVPQDLPDHGKTDLGLDATDLRLALDVALKRLTPRERTVVALRYSADLSQADVASAMNCSVGTVKTLNHRALAKLREASFLDQPGRTSVNE